MVAPGQPVVQGAPSVVIGSAALGMMIVKPPR